MDFEYRQPSAAALALMREGHNHPEMVATLKEIAAEQAASVVKEQMKKQKGKKQTKTGK